MLQNSLPGELLLLRLLQLFVLLLLLLGLTMLGLLRLAGAALAVLALLMWQENLRQCPLPILQIMMDSVLASSVDYSVEDGQGSGKNTSDARAHTHKQFIVSESVSIPIYCA